MDAVCAQHFFQEVPSVPRHSRLRSTPLQRLEVEQITGHQSVQGRGGVIAMLYMTHWAGLSEPSWEREMDLHSPDRIFCDIGWALRTSTAKLSACAGLRLCPHTEWLRLTRCVLWEPTFGTKETMSCGGLGNSARAQPRTRYIWSDFRTIRGRLNFLFPRRAARRRRGAYEALGSCKSPFPRETQRNVDESLGVAVDN